jgi:hypothetical protein
MIELREKRRCVNHASGSCRVVSWNGGLGFPVSAIPLHVRVYNSITAWVS